MRTLFIALFFFPLFSSAQEIAIDTSVVLTPIDTTNEVLKNLTPPEYKGGEKGMMRFIKNHFIVPEEDKLRDVQGRVIVTFVVDEKGKVTYPFIRQGVSYGLNEEAIRIVKMLKFKSGKYKGEPCRVTYTLPIMIKYN